MKDLNSQNIKKSKRQLIPEGGSSDTQEKKTGIRNIKIQIDCINSYIKCLISTLFMEGMRMTEGIEPI